MAVERIFLDHASGGPLLPAARLALEKVLSGHGAAPGGGHREARESREVLELARKQATDFLGTEDPERVVFTSGGTEAVQAAIRGWGEAVGKGTIYLSEMEHPAVETAVRWLQKSGFSVVPMPVDGVGKLLWKKVKSAGPGLVCVHLAHHDLGTVQDLGQAKAWAESVKAQLFVDATFGAGWVGLPKELEGVDLLAVSGHRLGGPKGSGLLWVGSGCPWRTITGQGRRIFRRSWDLVRRCKSGVRRLTNFERTRGRPKRRFGMRLGKKLFGQNCMVRSRGQREVRRIWGSALRDWRRSRWPWCWFG